MPLRAADHWAMKARERGYPVRRRRPLAAWCGVAAALALWGCGAPYAVRHRVEPGETAASLAESVGATESELLELNRLGPSDQLRAGDTVFLPAPRPAQPSHERTAPRPQPPPPPPVDPGVPPVLVERRPPPPPQQEARPAPAPRPEAPAAPPQTPPAPVASSAFRWPVEGEILRGFGKGPAGENRGIDIAAAPGTKVRAAAAGKVLYSGTPAQAYGPVVILEHKGGLHTVYSNLGAAQVERGADVEAGGTVGTTGDRSRSLPPHLHFEVRKIGEPQNPLLVLPPP